LIWGRRRQTELARGEHRQVTVLFGCLAPSKPLYSALVSRSRHRPQAFLRFLC
jgi:hypothetical protein